MIIRGLTAIMCLITLAASALAQSAPPPNRVVTRIAFGSCANQEVAQPIWSAIGAYKPELFLFAGDNVYGNVQDGRPVTDNARILASLKAAYDRAAANPGMIALRADVPHFAIWDDNDYGKNDGGADFIHREASQQLFVDFWRLPADDPRRSRAGLYHAHAFGPAGQRVQVILLDTRFFRSPLKLTDQRGARGRERYLPDDTVDKTMLGAEQWTWLDARLREPADLRLIVSSIQVLAEGHGWEKWGNLPRERQRLYDLIARAGARRVLFLSGDRHIGALYRESRGTPYPLYEITSSGLTQFYSAAAEDGPNRMGPLYGAVNFGTIDIDWWAGTVTLSVRSMNGEPVRRQVIELGEITPDGR